MFAHSHSLPLISSKFNLALAGRAFPFFATFATNALQCFRPVFTLCLRHLAQSRLACLASELWQTHLTMRTSSLRGRSSLGRAMVSGSPVVGAPHRSPNCCPRKGCLTCRVRRKKCSGMPEAGGACESCQRLCIECLGYSAKRPSWMQVRDLTLHIPSIATYMHPPSRTQSSLLNAAGRYASGLRNGGKVPELLASS